MAVKGLGSGGSGNIDDLSVGIAYAALQGARVINTSWGCSLPCPSNPVVEEAVRLGLRYFDFGRSRRNTGACDFKRNQGFDARPLSYQYLLQEGDVIPAYHNSNPRLAVARRMFRVLPRFASERVGREADGHSAGTVTHGLVEQNNPLAVRGRTGGYAHAVGSTTRELGVIVVEREPSRELGADLDF